MSRSIMTALANDGFLVTPLMQRTSPDATGAPFNDRSALRSNFVPWSSLFLSPSHTVRGLTSVRSHPGRTGASICHVPISRYGFPFDRDRAGESSNRGGAAVGAAASRISCPVGPRRKYRIGDAPGSKQNGAVGPAVGAVALALGVGDVGCASASIEKEAIRGGANPAPAISVRRNSRRLGSTLSTTSS